MSKLPLTTDYFHRPVVVLTGLGQATAVSSVMEAYMFLADWPVSKRDAAHKFALQACLAALKGDVEVETARGLFVALAEKYDILAPDVVAFASSRNAGSEGVV